jgi:site-specific recombinase XerD
MDLCESLEIFLKFNEFEKNLSENTISSYRKDLEQFHGFLKKNLHKKSKTEINDILTITNVRNYLKHISIYKYSNNTVIRKYSSLQNYFRFLETNNYLRASLSQLMSPPKKHHDLYTFLSQNEIKQLVAAIDISGPSGVRNRALIEFLYSTGARVSEAETLKIGNLNLEKREAIVFGKGRKYRTVYLNSSAVEWLKKYLVIRESLLTGKKSVPAGIAKLIIKNREPVDSPGNSVFISKLCKKLSQRSMRTIVKQCVRNACIDKNISPHKLRHTFATHMLQEGAGIREIQIMLGHESISTTQIYTHLNVKKLKEDFEKFHPRAK